MRSKGVLRLKKYLWLLILLPLVGFAPVHLVVTGVGLAAGMSETSEETMSWYQCRSEVRKLNDDMKRILSGAERPVIKMSCRFDFGEGYDLFGEGYDLTPDDEQVISTLLNLGQLLDRCKTRTADLERRGHADKEGFKTAVKQCDVHERSFLDLVASSTDEQLRGFCATDWLWRLPAVVGAACTSRDF